MSAAPQLSPASASIVIIDDTALNLRLLADLLKRQGWHARPFPTGEQGLRSIEAELPDLILLDISLPDIDGYEICTRLKQNPDTREVPVIFVSARHEALDKVKAFRTGGVDFISKPFQSDEVVARIRTHLDLATLRHELEQRVVERTAQLEQLNAAYERFVPHEFLEILGKDQITDVTMGDQIHRAMAVMFTDIRDFTTLSESMTPQDNFNFINAYLKRVSPVIRRHGGVVDKYIGDSIMSLFKQNEVRRALDAILDVRREVASYNAHRHATGRRAIQVGTGMHVGDLMLGIIGEEQRLQGTVISDAVNLASRLESLTKIYGVSTIISQETLDLVDDPSRYNTRFLDLVQVKGKRRPVLIYEMFDGDEQSQFAMKCKTREDFERGLAHYHREEFGDACHFFKQVTTVNVQDHAAWLFLNKATGYKKDGVLPTDWVGIKNLTQSLPYPN